MIEIKKHFDYPNYLIYSDGRIFSLKYNKFLKKAIDKYGYFKIMVVNNKNRKYTTFHRIIAETFIPNPENKPQVNHKNGIKTDNRVENLEWVTLKENIQHSIDNKLKSNFPKGSDMWNSKITDEEIKFIRRLSLMNMRQIDIVNIVGFNRNLIYKVVNNLSYKNVK